MINIAKAELVGDYQINLCFDDGHVETVDFKPFLMQAVHPDIRAYVNTVKFKDFHIEYGELVWGDFDLCFPIEGLYKNQLFVSARDQLAA
jgi:hypothetical protein